MESREIITIISDVEERFSVNKWKIGSFYIWPYVRFRVGTRLSERKLLDSKLNKLVYKYIFGVFRYIKVSILPIFSKKENRGSGFLFLEEKIIKLLEMINKCTS